MHLLKNLPIFGLISAGLTQPLLDDAMPSFLSKRLDQEGSLGQYSSADCSGKVVSDQKRFTSPNGLMASVADRSIEPVPYLDKGTCTPWYPFLNQHDGPSVGVNFNFDRSNRIKQVQFFMSTPACAAAEAKFHASNPPDVCCHKDAGGLLGVINVNGTDDDFGATKGMGSKDITCAQIGPGHNQTLWQMRYFISR